jgi:UPF0716 protein FxsA
VRAALFGLLALPLAEIVAFAVVADRVGWLWAVALTFGAMLAGAMILSRVGRAGIARFRSSVADGRLTRVEISTGSFVLVAGALLLILPGFLSDVIGLGLIVRGLLMRPLVATAPSDPPRGPDGRPVIDLNPSEWRDAPPPPSDRP